MTSFKAGQKWATSRQLWDLLASAARQLSSKEVRAHFQIVNPILHKILPSTCMTRAVTNKPSHKVCMT